MRTILLQSYGGGGMGVGVIGGLLAILLVVFVLKGVLRSIGGKNSVSATLVLRNFKITESALAGDTLVEIVGRSSGFKAWLLTVMGLSPETTFKVSRTEVSYKGSSLSGETHQIVPLPSVASTHCGYTKSIFSLILGIIIILGGLLIGTENTSILLLGLVIGGLFIISYWLSKKIIIKIETSGGLMMGIAFKRSVIENVPVNMEQALKVIKIVNEQVVKSQVGNEVM